MRLPSSAFAAAALLTALTLTGARAAPGDWPQWRGPARDGVWRETGLLDRFPGPQLKLRWKAPIANGYSAPTVADGRVYVTDRVADPKEVERVHCFDRQTGKPLWTHVYDCPYRGIGYPNGPRAAVAVDEGHAYSLGAMGHLFCLDAAAGRVLWSHDLNAEYRIRMATWGVAASPLIENGLVIVQIGGSDNACLAAFDKKTGQERWRALSDMASYSAPIIVQQAGKRVLVCVTGENIVGLDPRSGKLYWQYPWPARNRIIITIATPVVSGDRLLVASFYDGAVLLRLKQDQPAVEKIWQRRGVNERMTDAIQPIISTPVFEGDYIYGVDSYGELRCLDARTGDRLWESLEAVPKARWSTIHFVRNGDRTWMLNERGQLIIARLTPGGYEEISRAQLLKPTTGQLPERGGVCWAHPAYAYGHVFARNDEELVCADLRAGK